MQGSSAPHPAGNPGASGSPQRGGFDGFSLAGSHICKSRCFARRRLPLRTGNALSGAQIRCQMTTSPLRGFFLSGNASAVGSFCAKNKCFARRRPLRTGNALSGADTLPDDRLSATRNFPVGKRLSCGELLCEKQALCPTAASCLKTTDFEKRPDAAASGRMFIYAAVRKPLHGRASTDTAAVFSFIRQLPASAGP